MFLATSLGPVSHTPLGQWPGEFIVFNWLVTNWRSSRTKVHLGFYSHVYVGGFDICVFWRGIVCVIMFICVLAELSHSWNRWCLFESRSDISKRCLNTRSGVWFVRAMHNMAVMLLQLFVFCALRSSAFVCVKLRCTCMICWSRLRIANLRFQLSAM